MRTDRLLRRFCLSTLLAIVFSQGALAQEAATEDASGNSGPQIPTFGVVFTEYCAVCHGENLKGAAQGTPLVGADLIHGDSMSVLIEGITNGYPDKGETTEIIGNHPMSAF